MHNTQVLLDIYVKYDSHIPRWFLWKRCYKHVPGLKHSSRSKGFAYTLPRLTSTMKYRDHIYVPVANMKTTLASHTLLANTDLLAMVTCSPSPLHAVTPTTPQLSSLAPPLKVQYPAVRRNALANEKRTSAFDGERSPLLALMRCSPSPLHPVTPSSPRLCNPAPPRRVSHARLQTMQSGKTQVESAKFVRSEKTHTRKPANSAVRKDTRKASKVARSDKTRTRLGTIAVRKDTQARRQILCGQKRHTCKTILLRRPNLDYCGHICWR